MTKEAKITAAYLAARQHLFEVGGNLHTARQQQARGEYRAAERAAVLERSLADARTRHEDEKDRIWAPLVDAFRAVNGRASAFALDHDAAIARAIEAERDLEKRGVPVALRAGCEAWESSAGPDARAYKYAAAGTRYGLRRDSKGNWSLISVERISVRPCQRGKTWLVATPAARDAIIRRALDGVEAAQGAAQAQAA